MSVDWNNWYKMLLALVLWREARGEGRDGIRAVAHVIRNRVLATHLDDKWDDIVAAKWQFSSMTAPGDSQLVRWPNSPDPLFATCMEVAEAVYEGRDEDNTGGARYYANLAAVPPESSFWKTVANNPEHPMTVKIGHHTFYR